jgi:poly-gamma-glutamate synthesis protein (capsule biosynthesis protein)
MLRIQTILLFLAVVLLSSACQGAQPALPSPSAAALVTQAAPPADLLASPWAISTLPPTPSATPEPAPQPTATPPPTSTPPAETTLLFTGVIVPARCVQAAIDASGNPDYPYEEVRSIIQQADLAIGTLNATISDYPPRTGCVPTYVLVGGANNADALARAGFDAMSVATNHIKNCGPANCGERAFFDTLENLRRVGIAYVGAGENHDQAIQPIVLTVNGVRFGIISLGQIEPMAFAGPDRPGIAVLNEDNLRFAIAEARKISDVVIAMPHWGPEDVATPNWIQRGLAQELVAAGADLVVGNHTHVVQGIQEIEGIPVFYGLGNFVFDQDLNDHQQGVILKIHFRGAEYTGYELVPIQIGEDGRVRLANPDEAAETLQRIEDASLAIKQNR